VGIASPATPFLKKNEYKGDNDKVYLSLRQA
jgi:hypothetical protein